MEEKLEKRLSMKEGFVLDESRLYRGISKLYNVIKESEGIDLLKNGFLVYIGIYLGACLGDALLN